MRKKNIAIFGLGVFGKAMAEELSQTGNAAISVFDDNEENISDISVFCEDIKQVDFTKEEAMRELMPDKFDAVILDKSSSFEEQVISLQLLRKYNAKYIVVKTNTKIRKQVLESIGADRVILPEQELAKREAEKLCTANILDYWNFEGAEILELIAPSRFCNKTIINLDLRKNFRVTALMIEKEGESHYEMVTPDTMIARGDRMIIFGAKKEIDNIKNLQ